MLNSACHVHCAGNLSNNRIQSEYVKQTRKLQKPSLVLCPTDVCEFKWHLMGILKPLPTLPPTPLEPILTVFPTLPTLTGEASTTHLSPPFKFLTATGSSAMDH